MTVQSDIALRAVDGVEKEYREEPAGRGVRFRPSRLVLNLLLIAASLLMALPFLWMIFSSFKPLSEIFIVPPKLFPQEATIQNYLTAFGTGNFVTSLFNSLYIATLVTVISLITCAMAAYAFARINFFGRNTLFGIFLATLMVPFQLTVIPTYIILGQLRWIDTHLALIVPRRCSTPSGCSCSASTSGASRSSSRRRRPSTAPAGSRSS